MEQTAERVVTCVISGFCRDVRERSDGPENGSVHSRNLWIQDSMLHDTLDQLWFLKESLTWYPYL